MLDPSRLAERIPQIGNSFVRLLGRVPGPARYPIRQSVSHLVTSSRPSRKVRSVYEAIWTPDDARDRKTQWERRKNAKQGVMACSFCWQDATEPSFQPLP